MLRTGILGNHKAEVQVPKTFLMIALLTVSTVPGFAADWNLRLAADYLDGRQKEWLVWPRAKVEGGICVSCHTGVTYLLARPELRRALGESQATAYEQALLEGIHARGEALRSEEHTSELQSPCNLVCRLLLEKKNDIPIQTRCRESSKPRAA